MVSVVPLLEGGREDLMLRWKQGWGGVGGSGCTGFKAQDLKSPHMEGINVLLAFLLVQKRVCSPFPLSDGEEGSCC